jgi:hypothetical protein
VPGEDASAEVIGFDLPEGSVSGALEPKLDASDSAE